MIYLVMVCARAFITCQSAPAHCRLFETIFKIAEEDTGKQVQFRYMHGQGIETVSADAHKGEALGKWSNRILFHSFS